MAGESKPRLLLHVCCGPCSTYVVERLRRAYELTAYFYNPNIHPQEEYQGRLEEMRRFAAQVRLEVVVGEYDAERWFEAVKGYEVEPEGRRRCEICYRFRLEQTAKLAQGNKFPWFTTTLSLSPHKRAEKINQIGKALAEEYGMNFLAADFKKKDGFKISCQMSKKFDLRRQNYCGCLFSRVKRQVAL